MEGNPHNLPPSPIHNNISPHHHTKSPHHHNNNNHHITHNTHNTHNNHNNHNNNIDNQYQSVAISNDTIQEPGNKSDYSSFGYPPNSAVNNNSNPESLNNINSGGLMQWLPDNGVQSVHFIPTSNSATIKPLPLSLSGLSSFNNNSHTETDVYESKAVRTSIFAGARTVRVKISRHVTDLLFGTLHFLVEVATLLCSLYLIYYYNYDLTHFSQCSLGLLVILLLRGLVETEFDYFNRGRLAFILVNILNLRIFFDYFSYLYDWWIHFNHGWTNPLFHSERSFQTVHLSLPSALIQIYVILFNDEKPTTWEQIVAICITGVCIIFDLFPHFRYVHVNHEVYFTMMMKATFNTATRTVLVCYLFNAIGSYTYIWIGTSYVIGCVVYGLFVRYSHRIERDDPLRSPFNHVFFGGLVSQILLFVSIPFAPSHSIFDFWRGYLVSEAKMQIENLAMAVVVLNNIYDTEDSQLFWAALAFCIILYLGNILAIFWLDHSVKQQLRIRGLYSENSIVKLYSVEFAYLKSKSTIIKVIDNNNEDLNSHTNKSVMSHNDIPNARNSEVILPQLLQSTKSSRKNQKNHNNNNNNNNNNMFGSNGNLMNELNNDPASQATFALAVETPLVEAVYEEKLASQYQNPIQQPPVQVQRGSIQVPLALPRNNLGKLNTVQFHGEFTGANTPSTRNNNSRKLPPLNIVTREEE